MSDLMQRTLVLLKPDAVQRRLMGQLIARFEAKGLNIVAMKMLRVTPDLAKKHYAEHVDKPFYPGLEAFITGAPVVAMVVQGIDVIRVVREIATFFVEIVRGLPMLVILYYIAFVGAPALVAGLNWLLGPAIHAGIIGEFSIRKMDFVSRAILALTIGYSAFISEIFRGGIESVHHGQREAALSLGMTRTQAMFKVILPQAFRNVLPPLGNEFVAMIKDSALVSALGVQDITQIGKVYSASTFKFFETYNVVALLYLVMTITLSLLVRLLEKRLGRHKRISAD